MISIASGWLAGARHCPSPNRDDRPDDTDIDLLVVHNISLPPCQYGANWIEHLFLNRLNPSAHPYFAEIAHLRVSAHLLIRRDGEIIQFVPFNQRAWHAGTSCFQQRECCNDFSIGIELEGCDSEEFAPIQYDRLAETTLAIMAEYPAISASRIAGHSDIAPGRKTDPGPHFDWIYYRSLIVHA